MKTPAEDINNDMEKGEMVVEDRELQQLTTKRESSQNLSDWSLYSREPPKFWTIQLTIDVLMFMTDFQISKLLMLGLER